MQSSRDLYFVILAFVFTVFCVLSDELSRGWGDQYNWISFEDRLALARKERKPIMLVIHKSWCGACKALAPDFAISKDILEQSKYFIMVNIQDDEEPREPAYTPDGGYIPRILFTDCKGEVKKEIFNSEGSESYKYYYPEIKSIVQSMKLASKLNCETDKAADEL